MWITFLVAQVYITLFYAFIMSTDENNLTGGTMKTINITADAAGNITADSRDAGYYGEHNALVLSITPGAYFDGCEYYRIIINGAYSEKLTPTENIITYTVPQSVLRPPAIRCQIAGYKLEDGIPLLISRSGAFDLKVGISPIGEIPINPQEIDPFETRMTELANSVAVNRGEIEKLNALSEEIKQNSDIAELSSLQASMYCISSESAAKRAETAAEKLENLNAENVKYSTDKYTLSAANTKAALDNLFQKSTDFDSALASLSSEKISADDSDFAVLGGSNVQSVLKIADETLENVTLRTSALERGRQEKISANGILTADGNGNVSAATAGKDYLTPDNIDSEMSDTSGNAVQNKVIKKYIDSILTPQTFADVRRQIRLGRGAALFPVGYEFTTADSETGKDIVWVVRAHNVHKAADTSLKYTMTLEAKYLYSTKNGSRKAMQFDAPEAIYFAENGLAAGTYNFTVAYQTWHPVDNGKTFQFTLTKAVPAGGQLFLDISMNDEIEGKNIMSYSSNRSTVPIETVSVTEGSSGTSLGTTDGKSTNVNHMHRVIGGSNNYAQSAVRQWLNSAAAAGQVWSPTNKYDRAPSWNPTYNGFMHGLDPDFLNVVQPAKLPCSTSSVIEVNSLDGTAFAINQVYNLSEDKFFLLSRPEIFGTWGNENLKDGYQLEYYQGLSSTELIKRDMNGTANYTWLRSPYHSFANYECIVIDNGTIGNSNTNNGVGVAPACIIA